MSAVDAHTRHEYFICSRMNCAPGSTLLSESPIVQLTPAAITSSSGPSMSMAVWTMPTLGSRSSTSTVRSSNVGYMMSSSGTMITYSVSTAANPRLWFSTSPTSRRWRTERMRGSSKLATTSGVSSVDALSYTSNSKLSKVCARAASIDPRSQRARLCVGMRIETRGRLDSDIGAIRSQRRARVAAALDQLMVDAYVAVRHRPAREALLEEGAPALPQQYAAVGLADQVEDGTRERGGIVIHDDARAGGEQLVGAGHVRRHDRDSGRERLQRRDREPLPVGREGEHVGARDDLRRVVANPGEPDGLLDSEPCGLRLEVAPKRTVADDDELRVGALRAHQRGRLEEARMRLLRREPAHHRHHGPRTEPQLAIDPRGRAAGGGRRRHPVFHDGHARGGQPAGDQLL